MDFPHLSRCITFNVKSSLRHNPAQQASDEAENEGYQVSCLLLTGFFQR
jgi:hypothetical protein